MIEAHAHLAYHSRHARLVHAVLWFAVGPSVYGWYLGAHDGRIEASYFVLPDHYASTPEVLYRSVENDISGRWIQVGPRGSSELPHPPPVPQELRHDLSRLQDEFVRHWLFFDDDPDSEPQVRALRARGLAMRHVNVRPARLDKFDTSSPVWRYDAPGADRNVLAHLSQRWQLDERIAP